MLKNILHSCGHEHERDILESAAKWWTTQLCKECWIDEKNTTILAYNVLTDDLEGSDKQISWAYTIRSKTIEKIEAFIEEETGDEHKIALLGKLEIIRAVKDAGFWIDIKDHSPSQILSLVRTNGAILYSSRRKRSK